MMCHIMSIPFLQFFTAIRSMVCYNRAVPQPRTLAKFIGDIIDRTGLSNVEIAKALGVKPENVSRWRNQSNPQNIKVQHLETLLSLLTPKLTLGQCLFFPDEIERKEVVEALFPIIRAALQQQPAQVAQPPPAVKLAPKERRG